MLHAAIAILLSWEGANLLHAKQLPSTDLFLSPPLLTLGASLTSVACGDKIIDREDVEKGVIKCLRSCSTLKMLVNDSMEDR